MYLIQLLLYMPGGAEWILILIFLAFALALLGFWIYTIVEIAKSKFNDETSKIAWPLIVIFAGIIGSFIYWIFGRSNRVVVS